MRLISVHLNGLVGHEVQVGPVVAIWYLVSKGQRNGRRKLSFFRDRFWRA